MSEIGASNQSQSPEPGTREIGRENPLARGIRRVGEVREFRRDPLYFLERLANQDVGPIFEIPWGEYCVRDSRVAMQLLRDRDINAGLAPFFGDTLPSREAQISVGHAVRDCLRRRLPEIRATLAEEVVRLPESSQWPSAGVGLILRSTLETLIGDSASTGLRETMSAALRGDAQLQAPTVARRARTELLRLRPRFLAATADEVAHRRRDPIVDGVPADVLDAVLTASPPGTSDATVARLFELMVRSIVGTVGYSLAWAVLLGCYHNRSGGPLAWPESAVVRESQRMRPIVWMVGRRLTKSTTYAGTELPPGSVLSVSPYLLHHDPHGWSDPYVFRPQRWTDGTARGPYLPYSSGPFVCAGAAIAEFLLTDALTYLHRDAHFTIRGGDLRPIVTNISMPRRFVLSKCG